MLDAASNQALEPVAAIPDSANTICMKHLYTVFFKIGFGLLLAFVGTLELMSQSISLHVPKAGMLPQIISESRIGQIKELKLSGLLNEADVVLIRKMGGYYTKPTCGALSRLDLRDAAFLSGSSDEAGNASIDFRMFYATRFVYLSLPEYTRIIEREAFDGCNQMSTLLFAPLPAGVSEAGALSLPSSIEVIGMNAFRGCVQIHDIYLNSLVPPRLESGNFAPGVRVHIPRGTYQSYWLSNWGDYELVEYDAPALNLPEPNAYLRGKARVYRLPRRKGLGKEAE